MRFNGLKSHLRLQKLRFLDAPGLFLLEIVLTGAYDLADVLANVLVLKWMIGALMGRDLIRAAWVLGGFLVYQLSVSFLWHWYFERVYPQWKERLAELYEDSDDRFAFIAGYTDGGAPFGVMWEEVGI